MKKITCLTVTFNIEANWASFTNDLKAEMCFGKALKLIMQ